MPVPSTTVTLPTEVVATSPVVGATLVPITVTSPIAGVELTPVTSTSTPEPAFILTEPTLPEASRPVTKAIPSIRAVTVPTLPTKEAGK